MEFHEKPGQPLELGTQSGLYHITGDARIVRAGAIAVRARGAEDEYQGGAQCLVGAQRPQKLEAVHARHVEVEQYQIGFGQMAGGVLGPQDLQGDQTVPRRGRWAEQIVFAQATNDGFGRHIVVVDEQEAEGRGSRHELRGESAGLRN